MSTLASTTVLLVLVLQSILIMQMKIGNRDAPGNVINNYNLDSEGGDDYMLSQKMVHYCGGIKIMDQRAACKAFLCFQADAAISKWNLLGIFQGKHCGA
jgi:hypothetical protein